MVEPFEGYEGLDARTLAVTFARVRYLKTQEEVFEVARSAGLLAEVKAELEKINPNFAAMRCWDLGAFI